jgi:hypothetical protein
VKKEAKNEKCKKEAFFQKQKKEAKNEMARISKHEVHIEFSTENSVVLAGAVMKAATVLGLIGYEIAGGGGSEGKTARAKGAACGEAAAHGASPANSDIKKLIAISSIFHASRSPWRPPREMRPAGCIPPPKKKVIGF